MFKKVFSFFIITIISYAEVPVCLKGKFSNQSFHNELLSSSDKLIEEFRYAYGVKSTTGQLGCTQCSVVSTGKYDLKIQTPAIPKECIQGALLRKVGGANSYCRDNKLAGVFNGDRSGPCVTQEVVNYTSFLSSKVLNCFNSLNVGGKTIPLSASTFFSKINAESGFNFTSNHVGGVGIGQMTSIAIKEVNQGSARKFLRAITKSTDTSCQTFGNIIKEDESVKINRSSSLRSKGTDIKNHICEWTSLNRGVPRSMVYSLGYFAYIKSLNANYLKKKWPKLTIDDEFLDQVSLLAYSNSGPFGMRSALKQIISSSRSLQEMKAAINRKSYLVANKKRLQSAKKLSGGKCQI
ncbi:MAG: hypothetical protein L6Q37_13400 [Bdellovibrionaceae bacterium]|nr:hypothetical protein [Pseudobdellovibrionaceae bacterium]NUM58055.1 hypothetical protein [Pseudobdellovibrionaceae bacterium]